MKKTMIKTFYIDESRKAEGKPFKTIGETYILNGFWKKKSVENFLNRINKILYSWTTTALKLRRNGLIV